MLVLFLIFFTCPTKVSYLGYIWYVQCNLMKIYKICKNDCSNGYHKYPKLKSIITKSVPLLEITCITIQYY